MVSALFLPFTFVTGLLSMYITYPECAAPGPTWPLAALIHAAVRSYISKPKEDFYIITITCLALLAGAFVLFRRLRWI
jgi:general stress protein CsbA